MSPKNNYDDEALARALQIEYEREYRRRSMQQHLDSNEITANSRGSSSRNTNRVPTTNAPLPPPPIAIPSAPLSNSFYDEDDDRNTELLNNVVGTHRGITTSTTPQTFPRPSFIMAEDRFGSVEISDEEYARRLEVEMLEEERRRNQRKQHLQQQRDSYRAASSMNRGSNNVNRVSTMLFRVPAVGMSPLASTTNIFVVSWMTIHQSSLLCTSSILIVSPNQSIIINLSILVGISTSTTQSKQQFIVFPNPDGKYSSGYLSPTS